MKTKEVHYVEKYYLNNYAGGELGEEVRAVGKFVAENAYGKVLDCGCGPVPQLYAIFMPRMEELYAIDLPQESIDFVKEKIATVQEWSSEFLQYQKFVEESYGQQAKDYILQQVTKIQSVQRADMSVYLPFPDNYFDIVTSFYSLGCLRTEGELKNALIQIERALKPGGKLLHVNTNGKNSNDDLPAYTWRGLDQTSGLIKKYLERLRFTAISEQQTELTPSTGEMYHYSQISLLQATKK